jgi:hypothetical protein
MFLPQRNGKCFRRQEYLPWFEHYTILATIRET